MEPNTPIDPNTSPEVTPVVAPEEVGTADAKPEGEEVSTQA